MKFKRKITLLLCLLVAVVLVACGDNNEMTNSKQSDATNNEEKTNGDENNKLYQVGETAQITSRGYDFEYEATVNEYEITDKSDRYDMSDFYMDDYDDAYIVISNVTIHNTSDENFTPSKHIPMHVSESGNKAGEDVIFDYFPEFEENLAPGDSITGDLITHAEIVESDEIEGFWLKFETITNNETKWELPNTVK